ncbi:uncharacterized protein BDW70DRAFT_145735 [Aspergillus foveolatus]|uniref:uncharacterized protein n=1 Tax=Aspergillus foveolatus TaxID=210207 RepID=UPI003CCD34B0
MILLHLRWFRIQPPCIVAGLTVHLPEIGKDFSPCISNNEIHTTRHNLIDATGGLHDLIAGTRGSIRWVLVNSHTLAISLHATFHFMTQAVPLHRCYSFPELAKAMGLPELDISCFIRCTAVNRIFAESGPG